MPDADPADNGPVSTADSALDNTNSHSDHQGQWTPPQQQSGDEPLAYPNPSPGD